LIAYDYANNRDEVLCTGDQSGQLKFWDANFYNFQTITPFQTGAGAVGNIGSSTSGGGAGAGGDAAGGNDGEGGRLRVETND
jgi:hypothetical protein